MFRKIRTYRGRTSNSVLLYVCTQHFTQNRLYRGLSYRTPNGRQSTPLFAAGWLVFGRTSAVRAEQQEAMQTVSGQFSSGHRNDRNPPSESPRHFAALRDESVIVGYYTSRRKCIPVPQPSAAQQKGADFYGQKRRNRPHLCP